MQCPVCKLSLTMADRQGVEIDYCPQCRGVWLDRGELDKIVERSGSAHRLRGTDERMVRLPSSGDERLSGNRSDDDDSYRKRKQWGERIDFD